MPQTPSIASSASSEVIDPLDVALAQLEPDQVHNTIMLCWQVKELMKLLGSRCTTSRIPAFGLLLRRMSVSEQNNR